MSIAAVTTTVAAAVAVVVAVAAPKLNAMAAKQALLETRYWYGILNQVYYILHLKIY